MTHIVTIEVVGEDGTTDVLVDGAPTDAPLVPRGELIEVWDQRYLVLSVTQALTGYGTDLWTAGTLYVVEPVDDGSRDRMPVVPSPQSALLQEIWQQRLIDAFTGELRFSQHGKAA